MSKTAVEEQQEVTLEPLVTREKDSLRCELTTDERVDYGSRQATLLLELSACEDELNTFKATMKSRVAEKEAELKRISENIRNGYVFRQVDIEKKIDFAAEWVTYTRTDTGEIYHQRAMRADERQFALDATQDIMEAVSDGTIDQ